MNNLIKAKGFLFLQVNQVTTWIDGSSIYGTSSSWCDALRSFHGGLLSTGSSSDMPKQTASSNFMWSAPNPCTGQTHPQGLYGKSIRDFIINYNIIYYRLYLSKMLLIRRIKGFHLTMIWSHFTYLYLRWRSFNLWYGPCTDVYVFYVYSAC